MSDPAAATLSHLGAADAERERRASTPGLAGAVDALKEYQQRRFSLTYADLLQSERYGAASRFFLDELYGPSDFTRRDAQFARVVPALVRLFPADIVATVETLAELHALSEALDTAMGMQLGGGPIEASSYQRAWRAAGRRADRERQIALTLAMASQLDRLTRRPLLRKSLRLMRGPARAAGLAELQRFLEAGFDTFRAMHGAHEFIALIDAREHALAQALFDGETMSVASTTPGGAAPADAAPLAWLPAAP